MAWVRGCTIHGLVQRKPRHQSSLMAPLDWASRASSFIIESFNHSTFTIHYSSFMIHDSPSFMIHPHINHSWFMIHDSPSWRFQIAKWSPQTISNWYGATLPLLVPLFEPVVARKRPQSCYLQAASNAAAFDNIVPNRWDLPQLSWTLIRREKKPHPPQLELENGSWFKNEKRMGIFVGVKLETHIQDHTITPKHVGYFSRFWTKKKWGNLGLDVAPASLGPPLPSRWSSRKSLNKPSLHQGSFLVWYG